MVCATAGCAARRTGTAGRMSGMAARKIAFLQEFKFIHLSSSGLMRAEFEGLWAVPLPSWPALPPPVVATTWTRNSTSPNCSSTCRHSASATCPPGYPTAGKPRRKHGWPLRQVRIRSLDPACGSRSAHLILSGRHGPLPSFHVPYICVWIITPHFHATLRLGEEVTVKFDLPSFCGIADFKVNSRLSEGKNCIGPIRI